MKNFLNEELRIKNEDCEADERMRIICCRGAIEEYFK